MAIGTEREKKAAVSRKRVEREREWVVGARKENLLMKMNKKSCWWA